MCETDYLAKRFLQMTQTWALQWLGHGPSLQDGMALWVVHAVILCKGEKHVTVYFYMCCFIVLWGKWVFPVTAVKNEGRNILTLCFYFPRDTNATLMYTIYHMNAFYVIPLYDSSSLHLFPLPPAVDVYGELFVNSIRGSVGVQRSWPGKRLDPWWKSVRVSEVNTE